MKTYSLGWWDAKDGKGYREHTLTEEDLATGFCEYLGYTYEESELESEWYRENYPKLEAELAKYKQEAKKIPDFCYYHNIDGGCNILECTMSICPKHRKEEGQ